MDFLPSIRKGIFIVDKARTYKTERESKTANQSFSSYTYVPTFCISRNDFFYRRGKSEPHKKCYKIYVFGAIFHKNTFKMTKREGKERTKRALFKHFFLELLFLISAP